MDSGILFAICKPLTESAIPIQSRYHYPYETDRKENIPCHFVTFASGEYSPYLVIGIMYLPLPCLSVIQYGNYTSVMNKKECVYQAVSFQMSVIVK
jgi:hypothetical protein